MNFGLTDTQQTLKTTARKFLAAECPNAEVRRLIESPSAFDEGLWRKIADQGWTGILFDEEHGGSGMALVDMAVVLEEMGRSLLPGPYLSTVLLAGSALAKSGATQHLRSIAEGHTKATVALLEQSASWSLDAIQLRADGSKLNGGKLFVSDAGISDLLLVAARMQGELALFAVPAQAAGVHREPMPSIDLTRPLYAVTFDQVNVPADSLLASGDQARAALEYALAVATTGLVAEMTGGMQRLLEITVEYAKTRKQFGEPIGKFQAVQHQCADMLLYTESSRSAAYYAAWALQEGVPEAAAAISIAKAYASDAYREVGNRAIQVHGGMGFTWENDAHLYYRRAKASELAFGDANWHREQIASRVVTQSPRLASSAA